MMHFFGNVHITGTIPLSVGRRRGFYQGEKLLAAPVNDCKARATRHSEKSCQFARMAITLATAK